MAKTKLKSVFTREDAYTVLQLIKALADSVDDNEALTDEDIKKLQDKVLTSVAVVAVDDAHKKIVLTFADNTTIESIPFESGGGSLPQGYEVDSTGKVIINKALTVASEGDVEVGKNLIVDGKTKINDKDDIIDTSGNIVFPDTSLVTLLTAANVQNYKYKQGLFYISGSNYKTFIMGYIAGVFTGNDAITVEGIVTYDIRSLGSCASFSSYDASAITVNYKTGNVISNDLSLITSRELSEKVKTYYRHTVTITCTGSTSGYTYKICFTDYATKNTKIDSFQDLNTVFGGKKIACSGAGTDPGADNLIARYIDLHGGTVATDHIMFNKAVTLTDTKVILGQTESGLVIAYDDDVSTL